MSWGLLVSGRVHPFIRSFRNISIIRRHKEDCSWLLAFLVFRSLALILRTSLLNFLHLMSNSFGGIAFSAPDSWVRNSVIVSFRALAYLWALMDWLNLRIISLMVRKLVHIALCCISWVHIMLALLLRHSRRVQKFLVKTLEIEVYLSSCWCRSGLSSLRTCNHLHVSYMQVLCLKVKSFLHVQELTHDSCVSCFRFLSLSWLLLRRVMFILRGWTQIMLRISRLLLPRGTLRFLFI